MEAFPLKELRKATEEFSSSNLIEDSVFHSRLNGKNIAIKCMKTETVSKVEFGLFHDLVHHHPNIIRLLGVSVAEEGGLGSYLVFEYAKNGYLKDWLHGGIAMKSQFIASCYCFLTWNQRLRICLDTKNSMPKLGILAWLNALKMILTKAKAKTRTWIRTNLVQAIVSIEPKVLSGQLPISRDSEKGKGSVWLSEKIKFDIQTDNAEELREWTDNALGENYSFDAAITIANIARACVKADPSLRPNAGEIVEK
ncbi:hypothetical protein LguiB_020473 [Lonicera macranthoides]